MEVRNRFKGLDLIDRVPDELWTEVHDTVQETGIKTIVHQALCLSDLFLKSIFHFHCIAGVQPRWIQGIRSGDGVGKENLFIY